MKPNVLVVEDDALIAAGLAAALSGDGHVCEVAGSGEDALERLAQVAFDLALVDVGLPGIDGFEVARRRRGSGGSRCRS